MRSSPAAGLAWLAVAFVLGGCGGSDASHTGAAAQAALDRAQTTHEYRSGPLRASAQVPPRPMP